jgi:hypothetical protein
MAPDTISAASEQIRNLESLSLGRGYSVRIFGDGRIEYEYSGQEIRTKRVEERALRRLKDKIQAIGYFDLPDKVGCSGSQVTDVFPDRISVRADGKSKAIDIYPCFGPLGTVPAAGNAVQSLKDLADLIDEIAGTAEWLQRSRVIERDRVEAERVRNSVRAMQVGADFEREGKRNEAIKTYIQGARGGSCEAARRLGDIYANGLIGAPRDNTESAKWYGFARALGCDAPAPKPR